MSTINHAELIKNINAIVISHNAYQEAFDRISEVMETSQHFADPRILMLLGESRTGKSRLLNVIRQHWQCQRTDEGLEAPVIYVQLDRKPTIKGLLAQILYTLGDPAW